MPITPDQRCSACGRPSADLVLCGSTQHCRTCDCVTAQMNWLERNPAAAVSDQGLVRVMEARYRPQLVYYGSDDHFLGVELEVQASSSERVPKVVSEALGVHAYYKRDGSIPGGGFEIVTHPHTLAEHRLAWEKFFSRERLIDKMRFMFAPAGLRSFNTGNCGMHVHVGRETLTKEWIGKLSKFVNASGNLHFIETISQRTNTGGWCSVVRDKPETNLSSESRYEALNLTNRGTIEFRIFRGNTRKDRFFKNLEFVHSLIAWTKERSATKLSHIDFVHHIEKHGRETYPNLWLYLIERQLIAAPKDDPTFVTPANWTQTFEIAQDTVQ